jgi:LacI family transcriptional regulator
VKTLKDVAKLANVSEGTASLVLNNRPGISGQTRKRVQEAAQILNYSPNNNARGLAMNRTHTLGLVVTDIENPFFGSFTRLLDDRIKKEGYSLILSVSNDNPEDEEKIILEFIGKRVDGVIIIPSYKPIKGTIKYIDKLTSHSIPFIFSTTYYPGYDAPYVMTDLEEGSHRLTRYLLDLGHRRIFLFASQDQEIIASKLRIDGFKRAFLESDQTFHEDFIIDCKKPDYHSGYSLMKELLNREKPDAVTTINDILALGAEKAILEKGLVIPDDISVAGYDDVIFSSISQIPLTTVRQDISRLCEETVNTLMDLIKKKAQPDGRKLISPELIVRKSTGIKVRSLS